MNFTFRAAISLLFLVWSWVGIPVMAQQEDLVAKAQKERALMVTGTALASQGERHLKAFKERYPFLNTTYSRASGETLTSKLLAEASAGQLGVDIILINNYTHRIFMKRNIIVPYLTSAMEKPPALPKYRQEFLKGVQLFPADWSLSDSFEEHNRLFREIFWKNK